MKCISNEIKPANEMLAFADIEYLKNTLPPTVEDEFFDYLKNLTPNDITIYALKEGSIAFPRRG